MSYLKVKVKEIDDDDDDDDEDDDDDDHNNNNNNNTCKTQNPSIDKSSSVKILSLLNIYMIYLNNMY